MLLKAILFVVFIILPIAILLFKYIKNEEIAQEDKKDFFTKIIYVCLCIAFVYGILLLIQPSSYIEFNTGFNETTNTHL
jgi:hydrogenase-4 membrane subunit HyfE